VFFGAMKTRKSSWNQVAEGKNAAERIESE